MKIFPNQLIIENTHFSQSIEYAVKYTFNEYQVFIHIDFQNSLIIENDYLFYGECFHDLYPEKNNLQLLTEFNKLNTFKEKISFISRLSGYFIFCIKEQGLIHIVNDCAGQFEIYYFNNNNKTIIASQPGLILPLLTEQEKETDAPEYIIKNKINIFWKTPFKHIFKIIPNHILNLAGNRQERFYPENKKIISNLPTTAKKAAGILERSLISYSERKPLALALTAGWDSRVLFAASSKISDKTTIFVLNHNTPDAKIDVTVAEKIAAHFNKKLLVVNYNLENGKNAVLSGAVWKDEEKIHLIALNNKKLFPEHYFINGNISEIARNFYDPLPKSLSAKDICFILGIKPGNYEINIINSWLKEIKKVEKLGFHILDFLYWEHKMPNWAGNAKSISNLYNTVISPFNNRYLLDILLSTHRKYRDKTFHLLYKEILQVINLDFNFFKINPTRKNQMIKFMKKSGIYTPYRILFFKTRKLKF